MHKAKVHFRVPLWAAMLYVAGAVIILPWTMYLAATLPERHIFVHWDAAWVGLDIGLLLSLFLTGVLVYKKSLWVTMSATSAGSLLLLDAWFDLTGAHHGGQLTEAVVMALCLELPVAIVSFLLAVHVIKRAYLYAHPQMVPQQVPIDSDAAAE